MRFGRSEVTLADVLLHRIRTSAAVGLVAASLLLPPSSAAAETSSRERTAKGAMTFSCSSPAASFRVFGSELAGYEAVVLVATVGGTSYYAGRDFLHGVDTQVTYEGGHFVAEIPVRLAPMPSAPLVGLLTVSADLVAGRLQVVNSSGDGSGGANQQATSNLRYRVLAPAGDVRLVAPGGAEVVVGGCSGTISMGSSSVSSNPHATVDLENHAEVACAPFTVGGDTYALFMPPTTTPPETAELFLISLEEEWGATYVGSAGEGSALESWAQGVSFDLTDGGGVVGAVAEVRFVSGESAIVPVHSGTWTAHLDVTLGRVVGTLTFPDGTVVPLSCDAWSVDDRFRRAGGAPAITAPPSNDLPGGALPLAAGTSATASTSGASPRPEEPMECMTYSGGFDGVTNTVWYTVTGSGPLTIDTAGTRFDSAVAVYAQDGAGGLEPVPDACVDDTGTELGPLLVLLNLQASVTFDAEPGVTYLVQVGGTDADQNWGTLRVSVR